MLRIFKLQNLVFYLLVGGKFITKLLVSPKNVEEGKKLSSMNVDIVDVKNPREGSLGANYPWVISKIREEVSNEIPVSAAIGDFPHLPGSASLAALGASKAGANIIKVGLMGSKTKDEANFLMKKVKNALNEGKKSPKVVVCAYGDFKRANTINPSNLIEIGKISKANYIMMDTAIKGGKPLTNFVPKKKLSKLIKKAHKNNLKVAVAGSLGIKKISELKTLEPDVIGVRGAACEEGNRKKEISKTKIQELKNIIKA